MKNEDFLEMLGNIDDSIIDECAPVPVAAERPRIIKYVVSLAAVFLFTVCAILISRIVPDGLLTGFIGNYVTSGNNETESMDFSEDGTTEPYTEEAPVTEEPVLTEEPSSSEQATDIETTVPSVPESTTASDITVPSEVTTVTEIPSEQDGPQFVEVPWGSLIFAETDGLPDDYPERKRVSWTELLRIYGKVIIPSAFGEIFPEYHSIINDSHLVVSDGINTRAENLFRFTLSDGSLLDVKVSNYKLTLSDAEAENMDSSSEIEGVSVLLLKGSDSGNEMIFSAYFEKSGVYYRITQQGKNLSEAEFVDIIKNFI